MQVIVNNQPVDLYGEDLKKALVDGIANPVKTEKFGVQDDDGNIFHANSLEHARDLVNNQGFKLFTREDALRDEVKNDPFSEVKTFGKEALGAASFGITDFARDKEFAHIERDENPIATLAGQATGYIAPALLTSGTSLGLKAAQVGAKVAEKVTANAVGQAVVKGALGGGAQAVQQLAKEVVSPLDDVDLSHTLTTLGTGVLTGGILGGGLAEGKVLLDKFFNPAKLRADVLAQNQTSRTLANKEAAKVGKSLDEYLQEGADSLHKKGLLSSDAKETVENIKKANQIQYGNIVDEFKSAAQTESSIIEKAGGTKPSFLKFKSVDGEPSVGKDLLDLVHQKQTAFNAEINERLSKSAFPAKFKSIAASGNRVFENLKNTIKDSETGIVDTFQQMHELRKVFGQEIQDPVFKQTKSTATKAMLGKIYNETNDIIQQGTKMVEKTGGLTEVVSNLKKADEFYSQTVSLRKIVEKSAAGGSGLMKDDHALPFGITAALGFSGHGIAATLAPLMKAMYSKPGAKLALANIMESNLGITQHLNKIVTAGTGISLSPTRIQQPTEEQNIIRKMIKDKDTRDQMNENIRNMATQGPTKEAQGIFQRANNVKVGAANDLTQHYVNAANFLASKIPTGTVLPGGNRVIQPTVTQLNQYADYVHAVTSPDHMLDKLQKGTPLTKIESEVLQNVYPKMHEQLIKGYGEAFGARKQINPAVSNLAGVGKDSWDSNVAFLQNNISQPVQQPQKSGGAVVKASDRSKVTRELGSE